MTERQLEKIIDLYDLIPPERSTQGDLPHLEPVSGNSSTFGLPPCAQRMLREGVKSEQRVSCFRLAVQLKKVGMPQDIAFAALQAWAAKNTPDNGKGIITDKEIAAQVSYAYNRNYRGCGCQEPAIAAYCDPTCPIHSKRRATVPTADESSTHDNAKGEQKS